MHPGKMARTLHESKGENASGLLSSSSIGTLAPLSVIAQTVPGPGSNVKAALRVSSAQTTKRSDDDSVQDWYRKRHRTPNCTESEKACAAAIRLLAAVSEANVQDRTAARSMNRKC
jgi:hypothetical protein